MTDTITLRETRLAALAIGLIVAGYTQKPAHIEHAATRLAQFLTDAYPVDVLNSAHEILDGLGDNTQRMPFHARHADYISPDVPAGYDTILGHLARNHPDILDVIDCTVPDTTQRDGFALAHMSRRAGMCAVHVVAPLVMQRAGIWSVRAYPITHLATRW